MKKKNKVVTRVKYEQGYNTFWLAKKKVVLSGYMMVSLVFILCTFSALLWIMSQYIFHIFLPKFVDMLDQWEVLGERQRKGESRNSIFLPSSFFRVVSGSRCILLLFWHLDRSPSFYLLDLWGEVPPWSWFQPDILSFWLSVTSC